MMMMKIALILKVFFIISNIQFVNSIYNNLIT